MNKCEVCGTQLKALLTSEYCPNEDKHQMGAILDKTTWYFSDNRRPITTAAFAGINRVIDSNRLYNLANVHKCEGFIMNQLEEGYQRMQEQLWASQLEYLGQSELVPTGMPTFTERYLRGEISLEEWHDTDADIEDNCEVCFISELRKVAAMARPFPAVNHATSRVGAELAVAVFNALDTLLARYDALPVDDDDANDW